MSKKLPIKVSSVNNIVIMPMLTSNSHILLLTIIHYQNLYNLNYLNILHQKWDQYETRNEKMPIFFM